MSETPERLEQEMLEIRRRMAADVQASSAAPWL
jgi:hypothetical protein